MHGEDIDDIEEYDQVLNHLKETLELASSDELTSEENWDCYCNFLDSHVKKKTLIFTKLF